VPVSLAILAIVVMLPALGHGWFLDDMLFRARFLASSARDGGTEEVGGPVKGIAKLSEAMSGLYAFFRDDEGIENLRNYGAIPWWTDPDCRISFWRPVTSFTMWLDYQLYPNSVALQHLHSVLWFGGAAFVLAVLYRRLNGATWIAGLAGLLYVLDDTNYFPVAFVANRNAVIALFFGLLAVLMHDKWRRERSIGGAVLACVFLALSLLSAEAGVATAAYIGAYALVFEQGRLSRRIGSLIPAAAVVILWWIVHGALGYSTYASGVYIDPAAEPVRFAAAMLERTPLLLFAELFGSPADAYYMFSDPARIKVYAVVAGVLLALLATLRPLLRKNRVARFWALGMLFAVVPICATMASNRNLLFVGVGAMGLVAQFVGGTLSKEGRPTGPRLWRMPVWTFCGLFLFVHVVCSAGGRAIAPFIYSKSRSITEMTFDLDLPDDVSNYDVVVVNSPAPLFLIGLPAKTALEGRGVARSLRVLAPAFSPLKVTRTADKAVEVRATTGSLLFWERPKKIWLHFIFFLQEFNTIFREPSKGFEVGEKVELDRLAIEVKAVDADGQPVAVEFRFDVSPDDPSMRWFVWEYRHKKPFSMFAVPAVGESVEIAGVPW